MTKDKFIVIAGPTASGKTKVSVAIAKELGGEIISADSMQIYRGFDIGTAKTSQSEMQLIPHHMIDIVDPNEEFSVAEFQKKAFSLIGEINQKGKKAIISGGTGLYINSLVYKLDFSNVSRNDAFRQKYAQLYDDKNTDTLYNILEQKDSKYAKTISRKDKNRIIRRLEILEHGGGDDYNFRRFNEEYEYIIIGLKVPREELYRRINIRVDSMIQTGLVDEARQLYEKYGEVNALNAIGYKELIPFYKSEYTLEEAVNLIKRNTRRYAKRQMTWFIRDERIKWFDVLESSCIEDTINDIIIYIKRKGF